MSFMRTAFLLTFTMLIVGFLLGVFALGPLFGAGPAQTLRPIFKRSFSAAPPASPVAPAFSSPTASPRPTPTPVRPTPRPTRAPIPTRTPPPTRAPEPKATPPPTAISVSLQRYWLDETWVHPGQTIGVSYVIANNSGRTVHLLLGASLKPSRAAGWGAAINDPSHDVVAVIPPGMTSHLRYFTVPATLRPGTYDGAWGLKEPVTGASEALVTSVSALRVVR